MPSRYIASGVPEASPGSIAASDAQLPTYIDGDPETGFRTTIGPREVGYWGVTAVAKQVLALDVDPGNTATYVANAVVSLGGGNQRFVSKGAANLMERQLGIESQATGWQYLSNTLSPIQNVEGIDARLEFVDDDFDGESEAAAWLGENRDLAATAIRYGVDLPSQLAQARNRDNFMLIANRGLMRAQALQDVEQFEDRSYGVTAFTSMLHSAVQNYLLTDPTLIPSLVVPVGYGARAVSTVARFAGPALGFRGAMATRTASVAGNAVTRASGAMHGAATTGIAHRAASATALGAFGAAMSVGSQQGRIAESKAIFASPDLQDTFSWSELGLATGFSSLLGFALVARAANGRGDGIEGIQRTMGAVLEQSDQYSWVNPIFHSLDNVVGQATLDGASVRSQRAAEILMPGRTHVIGEFFDDAVLAEVGLTRLDIDDMLVGMVEGFKGQTIPEGQVANILVSALNEARRISALGIEAEAMTVQLQRSAFSEAMGRAGRLVADGAPEEVSEMARRIYPEVIKKIADRAKRIADSRVPNRGGSSRYWLGEFDELREAAGVRSLTNDEITYLMRVEGELKKRQAVEPGLAFRSIIDDVAEQTNRYGTNPLELAASNPLIASLRETRRLRKLAETAGRRGQSTVALRKQLAAEIRKLRALTGNAVEQNTEDFADVLKQTNELLAEGLERIAQQPKVARKAPAVIDPDDVMGSYRSVIDSMDLSETTLIEDVGVRNRLLWGWGLGKFVRRVIGSGPGLSETSRSAFDAVRMIAQEMDPNKLAIGDLTGRGAVKTMQSTRNDMEAVTSGIVGEMSRLVSKGRFGNQLNPIKRAELMLDFNKQVIRHVRGDVVATDTDVVQIAKMWTEAAGKVGQTAEDIGIFKQLNNFFPNRMQVHAIAAQPQRFVQRLSQNYVKFWTGTDEVFLDALVKLDVLKRATNKQGDAAWSLVSDGSEVASGSLKRSDLQRLGVGEQLYLDTLPGVLQDSAFNTRARLFGDDVYNEAADGGIVRVTAGNVQSSEQSRRMTAALWSDPDMEEFLDWNFLGTVHDYFRTTGFKVMDRQRHQQRWGIPGGSMDSLLDAVKSMAPKEMVPEEIAKWNAGINNLREKVMLAEGRMPSLRSTSNKVAEFLSDTGQASAALAFGSTIGAAVLSTEVLQSLLKGIHAPADITRKAMEVFRIAARTGETKELMEVVGLTTRQFRYHTLERFTGGAVNMDTFQFGVIPKVVAPFVDLFSKSGSALPGQGNPVAGLFRAVGGSSMTLGAMDYFSQFARVLQVMDGQAKIGRFLPAARKMAVMLEENADELANIRTTQGDDAYFKAWRGMARKSGFGANWDVADMFSRSNLLNTANLDTLDRAGAATGAIRSRGRVKVVDFNALMRHVPDDADKAVFDEVTTGLRDSIIGTMNKRVSEQNLLQTPTSANDRTAWGQLINSMTTFSRSWADNNLLDTAQLPTRTGTALIAMHIFGETLNRTSRELLRGREMDDIISDFEEDPDNYLARVLTNVPLAGQWTPFLKGMTEAITANDRMLTSDPVSSAGMGAIASAQDTVLNSIQAVSPLSGDAEFRSQSLRYAARITPFYNTWWFGGANEVARKTLGTTDLRAPVKDDRGPRARGYKTGAITVQDMLPSTELAPRFEGLDLNIPEG